MCKICIYIYIPRFWVNAFHQVQPFGFGMGPFSQSMLVQLFKIKVEQKSIATLGSLQDLNIAPVNHCDFLLDRIIIDRTIINRIIELIKSLVWVKCRCWAFQWLSLPSYTAARQLNCDGPKDLRLLKSLLNHGFWEVFNLGEIWGEGISVPRHPRLSKYPWNWLLYPISP